MRNPDWVRDEVILAMDLYFRAGRKQLPSADAEVVRLSQLLNRLPFHDAASREETFRNPNGISMILGNFLGIDPAHQVPGLSRNNHLQEEVWDDFADDEERLRRTAEAIERALNEKLPEESDVAAWSLEEVFPEGQLLTLLHLSRERNREVASRKKDRVLAESGALACEVCTFDFSAVYGELGVGFAECHHTRPLADLPGLSQTRLRDLAIVCANCHRMLHRGRPTLTVEQLRSIFIALRPGTPAAKSG